MYKWNGERYEQCRDTDGSDNKTAYDSRMDNETNPNFNYYFEVDGKWLVNCRTHTGRDSADSVAFKLSGSSIIHEIQKTAKYWVYKKYK